MKQYIQRRQTFNVIIKESTKVLNLPVIRRLSSVWKLKRKRVFLSLEKPSTFKNSFFHELINPKKTSLRHYKAKLTHNNTLGENVTKENLNRDL